MTIFHINGFTCVQENFVWLLYLAYKVQSLPKLATYLFLKNCTIFFAVGQ